MKISTRVTFDKASVKVRIKAANERALYITAEQVLKDSNMYAPEDQRSLIQNSESQSLVGKGKCVLIWSNPYARYQYYGVVMVGRAPKIVTNTPLKYTESGVHKMWAHYARAQHGGEWKKIYQNAIRKTI